MNIWEAIKQMRKLSEENKPFEFSFMSFNSSKGTSDGVVRIRQARLLKRESKEHNRYAEDMESFMDLDTMQPKRFWQPLLMSFNGEKVTV